MTREKTLLLSRKDVAALLSIEEYIAAVEKAFRLYGEGQTTPPGILGVHADDGGFHIKAGILELFRPYFAAKVNANFPQNVKRFGLPLIQGLIVLCDAENGLPLALMDSMEITIQRTGAATAVAAKYLARPESRTLTICGCGNQGQVSVRALSKIFTFDRVFAFDPDLEQLQRFIGELSNDGLRVEAVSELSLAVSSSDIVVTCTPANHFFLKQEHVRPGTFVAAVGADSEIKQELEPELLCRNKVVCDIVNQCLSIGELHHAVAAGVMKKEDVHAELGEVIAGRRPARSSATETIIFDSTGMALQDVIAAATVYEKAVKEGVGNLFSFGE